VKLIKDHDAHIGKHRIVRELSCENSFGDHLDACVRTNT